MCVRTHCTRGVVSISINCRIVVHGLMMDLLSHLALGDGDQVFHPVPLLNVSYFLSVELSLKCIYMGLRCKSKNFLDVVEPILEVNISSLDVGGCVPYVGL